MIRRVTLAVLIVVSAVGCLQRPTPNPNVLVVAIQTGPNNLDPRIGIDDASQKIDDLIFDSLMDSTITCASPRGWLNDSITPIPSPTWPRCDQASCFTTATS